MEHDEDKIGALPQTLLKFRERQKELKKRNEEMKKEQMSVEHSTHITHDKEKSLDFHRNPEMEIPSNTVNLIEESIFLSSKIIATAEDKVSLSNSFSDFFKTQKKVIDIIAEELDFDFNNPSHKTLLPRIGKVVTEIIYNNESTPKDKIYENVEALCKQVNIHKEYWSGNESVAPLLSIRARASTLEASMIVWNSVYNYPFCKQIDSTAIKIFGFVINASRDIALNWQEKLGSLERQQLYVSIVPIVANIADNCWQRFCLNNLNNDYHTIDRYKIELGKNIIDILEPSVIGIGKANEVSDIFVSKIMENTEHYSSPFYHIDRKSLNIVRKTIFTQIKNNITKYVEDNKSKIIQSIKKDSDYQDYIVEIIENTIEQTPPSVIINIDKFNEEFNDIIVQSWGAAQGIYKFRRNT